MPAASALEHHQPMIPLADKCLLGPPPSSSRGRNEEGFCMDELGYISMYVSKTPASTAEEVAFSDISSLNILKKKKKGSAREKLRLAEANHEIGCNYFCANVSKIHLS